MPAHDVDLFGTPDPTPQQPRVFSVSEVTKAVRGVIESAFDEVWIEGEVSNFRQQASGHQYFTLKDAGAQLSCVLFARGGAWRKTVALQDGMLVQARANSSDFLLRVYRVTPHFRTERGGPGTVSVGSFIQLRDPDRKIAWPIVNGTASCADGPRNPVGHLHAAARRVDRGASARHAQSGARCAPR